MTMNSSFKIVFILIFILAISGCLDKKTSPNATTETNDDSSLSLKLALTAVFSSLVFNKPLALYQSQDLNWFAVEQGGIVKVFDAEANTSNIFINISDKITLGSETGLLGMALHPDFTSNGTFYLSYNDNNGDSIISRFQSTNLIADAQSETIILTVTQPYSNHNGGQISFGSDGYLYIGLGDGGSSGDPRNNSQNINSLLGTILRIDVDDTNTYKIPQDNPFVNKDGKDEIYAYGLRNPWRFSFDKTTNELWAADVGQNTWEEVNIISKGENYGWNILEATHCYLQDNCNNAPYVAPIHEYPRSEGQSITGGFVYRGNIITKLIGTYIYADYVSGKIWGLTKKSDGTYSNQLFIDSSAYISSFAEDQAGNLYVIGHQTGKIYQITETRNP